MVPIIPHTQAVQMSKRLSEELIEERRGHLERFLRNVQVHPELEGVPSLSAFFSPDAEAFEAAKRAYPASGMDVASLLAEEDTNTTTAAKVSEKLKHFFVKATVKVKAARGGDLEETDDGAQMEAVAHYLNELDVHIKTIVKATLYLVNVSRESSANMHDLGQSLFGLHQLNHPESANNPYVVDSELQSNNTGSSNYPSIKSISNIFASLSAVHKVKYDEHQLKVGSLIQELEWSIKSARLALKRRKNAQLTYNTYLQQVKNREQALDKVVKAADMSAQPANSDGKVAELQKSIDSTREAANNARIELDVVTQRVFREMDRFKLGVDVELRKLYMMHARVERDYSEQLDCEWRKMLNPPSSGGDSSGGAEDDLGKSVNDAEEMQMIWRVIVSCQAQSNNQWMLNIWIESI